MNDENDRILNNEEFRNLFDKFFSLSFNDFEDKFAAVYRFCFNELRRSLGRSNEGLRNAQIDIEKLKKEIKNLKKDNDNSRR